MSLTQRSISLLFCDINLQDWNSCSSSKNGTAARYEPDTAQIARAKISPEKVLSRCVIPTCR